MNTPFSYPPITSEQKTWTRWWWLGSAVDKATLTKLLTQYRDAGLGGVEICPIYGAKGFEDRYLQYLSADWMEMLAHTTAEAKRLGLGVDFTDGTGWPFGGPQVADADASMNAAVITRTSNDGVTLSEALPKGRVLCAMAHDDTGNCIEITSQLKEGNLDPALPKEAWTIHAIITTQPIQKVKRAAPGAEGNVVDPYSVAALDHYLDKFSDAIAKTTLTPPRAHFHDSFEYFNANWTPAFLDEFQNRRGYDLREQLSALADMGDDDTIARVKCDYRETIHDLHLAYIERWSQWANSQKGLSRNQAHGAPGNLLDLYSAADIPETEIFGDVPDSEFTRIKFATSAAHLKGTTLASAESFTWLGEHFQVSLNDLKSPADFLFLAGINHLFLHGVPYSPPDVAWPGWLFYASVHFGPAGGLWRDFPAFNAYIARCQSMLQSGTSDNDLLLYFPQYDLWQQKEGLWRQCSVHNQKDWLLNTPFDQAAESLRASGYSYDIVSERWLAKARVENRKVIIGNHGYVALIVPPTRVMSVATLKSLLALAAAGAKIIFSGELPHTVPGFAQKKTRENSLLSLAEKARANKSVITTGDLIASLKSLSIRREPCFDHNIHCVRRATADGSIYFLVNRSDKDFEGWLTLGVPAKTVIAMDPLSEDRTGVAAIKPGQATQVFLQLHRGGSIILRTFATQEISGKAWDYTSPAADALPITGNWQIDFIEGGPVIPESYTTSELKPWTTRGDAKLNHFCGTARYTLRFARPAKMTATKWRISLGQVCDSARVKLNGNDLGTLWCEPFAAELNDTILADDNELIIEITNVAANRIADLDAKGVNWKAFHEINFVNREYKPFDASGWPLRDAGLLGPVSLTPLRSVEI